MRISEALLSSFQSARHLKEAGARVNAIDFHAKADVLVSSADDETIRAYDTNSGQFVTQVPCKKYGCTQVKTTHHHASILHASSRPSPDANDPLGAHAIRYLSLHDNKYISYFAGHSAAVNSLDMSPTSDQFLTAAKDNTVRLWDLRQSGRPLNSQVNNCDLPDPVAAFDRQGLIFAVSGTTGETKLFDVRNYQSGAFQTIPPPTDVLRSVNALPTYGGAQAPAACSSIRFSLDGKNILLSFDGAWVNLDSYSGEVKSCASTRGENDDAIAGSTRTEASFSPDGAYIVAGCADHAIRVWTSTKDQNSLRAREVARWKEGVGHAGVPRCVKWAPRRMLVASACQAVVLWLPLQKV